MADLNSLLRWSIENSTRPPGTSDVNGDSNNEQLSLKFKPSSSGTGTANSALHPSDPLYRAANDDISPASTPGPATPLSGSTTLPALPRRSDLTTEMLDVIMGRPDSAVMKEKMAIAVDESQDVEARVIALDDFEMVRRLTSQVTHGC